MSESKATSKNVSEEKSSSRPGSRSVSPVPGVEEAASGDRKATLVVPSAPVTRSHTSSGLSAELLLKSRTQLSHIGSLISLEAALEREQRLTLADVNAYSTQAEELHKSFLKEHAFLEVAWPSSHLEHEYFAEDHFSSETTVMSTIRRRVLNWRATLDVQSARSVHNLSDSSSSSTKLPDIALPQFAGDCLDWPAFSELFYSLIIKNDRLSDIERLHYLRTSTRKEAAQFVESFPLKGDSFRIAWDGLSDRYNSKRALIDAQLKKVFASQDLAKTSADITRMIDTFSEVAKTIQALGITDVWDCVMVHLATSRLPKLTHESWELSLGNAKEYPTYAQLEAFLKNKA